MPSTYIICGCGKHSDESPRSPLKLLLQLLEVLLADSLVLSAPQDLPHCRELLPQGHTLLSVGSQPTDLSRWIYKGGTISTQCRTAWIDHCDSRTPCEVSWACHWTCKVSWLLTLPNPAFIPSFHKCFSQAPSLKTSYMLNPASEST